MALKKNITDEKVREKLISKGASGLTDGELLSVIMRNGPNGESALELAERLLAHYNGNLTEMSLAGISRLRMFGSMGIARAAVVSAALELARRRQSEEAAAVDRLSSKDDVVAYFKPLIAELPYEEFWAVYLGVSNRILDKVKISQGGVSGTVVDTRLIIKRALDKLASSIIIVHNHPSGNPVPSDEDHTVTERLRDAASLFDIILADHVIITSGECFSFRAEGLL